MHVHRLLRHRAQDHPRDYRSTEAVQIHDISWCCGWLFALSGSCHGFSLFCNKAEQRARTWAHIWLSRSSNSSGLLVVSNLLLHNVGSHSRLASAQSRTVRANCSSRSVIVDNSSLSKYQVVTASLGPQPSATADRPEPKTPQYSSSASSPQPELAKVGFR